MARCESSGLPRNQEVSGRPHWKDYILFYEYFHGDNGAGLGASHQTGWTGIIARAFDLFARGSAADWRQVSKGDLAARIVSPQGFSLKTASLNLLPTLRHVWKNLIMRMP